MRWRVREGMGTERGRLDSGGCRNERIPQECAFEGAYAYFAERDADTARGATVFFSLISVARCHHQHQHQQPCPPKKLRHATIVVPRKKIIVPLRVSRFNCHKDIYFAKERQYSYA
jgi:hypothetical protein